jgi:hypothetical protein
VQLRRTRRTAACFAAALTATLGNVTSVGADTPPAPRPVLAGRWDDLDLAALPGDDVARAASADDALARAATQTTLGDPAYDTGNGGADIVAAAAVYQDGVIAVGLATLDNIDPYAYWLAADGFEFRFDTNGNGTADYSLVVTGHDSEAAIFGGVFTASGTQTCLGSQLAFEWRAAGYFAALPASCIASPASVRWIGFQFYFDEVDAVPDFGWSEPITNTSTAPPPPPPPAPPPPQAPRDPNGPVTGYWMLTDAGDVYRFGAAQNHGNAAFAAPATDLEPTPSGNGYWLLGADGSLEAHGDARSLGTVSAGSLRAGERVSAISATRTGNGYWLFTTRGRVFAFGDATHHGDMANVALNGAVIGSAVTPSGNGYWMVASDGGIFSFGDAGFFGSTGAMRLNQPIVGIAPDSDGTGYRLVAADGGIFAFDATFRGSMGSTPLNRPVVGAVAFGDGYLMVAADGGIFSFSTSPFFGSLGGNPPASPVVSVAIR